MGPTTPFLTSISWSESSRTLLAPFFVQFWPDLSRASGIFLASFWSESTRWPTPLATTLLWSELTRNIFYLAISQRLNLPTKLYSIYFGVSIYSWCELMGIFVGIFWWFQHSESYNLTSIFSPSYDHNWPKYLEIKIATYFWQRLFSRISQFGKCFSTSFIAWTNPNWAYFLTLCVFLLRLFYYAVLCIIMHYYAQCAFCFDFSFNRKKVCDGSISTRTNNKRLII